MSAEGYPAEWDKLPWQEMHRRWDAGEIAVEPFTMWCQNVRKVLHRASGIMSSSSLIATSFVTAPATLLECVSLTPDEADRWRREGRISEDLYQQFRQWWRLSCYHFSDTWVDTERKPVHPRVAEMLALHARR